MFDKLKLIEEELLCTNCDGFPMSSSWMFVEDGFHHPLLLERICPQTYRFGLEQQPYSYFEN